MTTNPNFVATRSFRTISHRAARTVAALALFSAGVGLAVSAPVRANAAETSNPATIDMTCSVPQPARAVRCASATLTPQGWASWMVLRGDGSPRGRAILSAPDHTVISSSFLATVDGAYPPGPDRLSHTFVDPTVKPGMTYTYVLWAVDSSGKPFAHSALSTVTVPGTPAAPETTTIPPVTTTTPPVPTTIHLSIAVSEPTVVAATRK